MSLRKAALDALDVQEQNTIVRSTAPATA